jgi:hypothetical protein
VCITRGASGSGAQGRLFLVFKVAGRKRSACEKPYSLSKYLVRFKKTVVKGSYKFRQTWGASWRCYLRVSGSHPFHVWNSSLFPCWTGALFKVREQS